METNQIDWESETTIKTVEKEKEKYIELILKIELSHILPVTMARKDEEDNRQK